MGNCSYEGTYDTTKITKIELENIYKLGFSMYFNIETEATVFSDRLQDIPKLSIDSLNKEYGTKIIQLKKLDIGKSSYWEGIRQKTLIELKQAYELKKTTIQGYFNPCFLLQYTGVGADSCITKYADALCQGGDKLIAVWKELVEEQCKKNDDPDKLRNQFNGSYNSPQRMLFAKNEVMVFGWWNCANAGIQYVENASEDEYLKLFKKVKNPGCDGD